MQNDFETILKFYARMYAYARVFLHEIDRTDIDLKGKFTPKISLFR